MLITTFLLVNIASSIAMLIVKPITALTTLTKPKYS